MHAAMEQHGQAAYGQPFDGYPSHHQYQQPYMDPTQAQYGNAGLYMPYQYTATQPQWSPQYWYPDQYSGGPQNTSGTQGYSHQNIQHLPYSSPAHQGGPGYQPHAASQVDTIAAVDLSVASTQQSLRPPEALLPGKRQ